MHEGLLLYVQCACLYLSLYVQVRIHLAMVCLGFCVSLSEFMWSWVGGSLASLSFVSAILWATFFP